MTKHSIEKTNDVSNYSDPSSKDESSKVDINDQSSSNPTHAESDITRYIRSSVERSMDHNSEQTTSTFRQIVDVTNCVISEIPVIVNRTNKIMNKMILVGQEQIQVLTNFKNSIIQSKEK